ncbi:MAG: energy-coupling factor ABC transporter permease [Betaproteobacteria bacterium]|nr:energy-coupling factor ABC transporter permease [Betaproteobacteria bacterium]
MHMADALLSPAVGATMWLATGVTLAACARGVRRQRDDRVIPLMGVLGAFVFAAQMVNFAIPGTGSSGHLGGGLLLAILLGPQAAFIAIASVLTVQALFFADGGLLALGANVFNLGFFPCFVAYPLAYRLIARPGASGARIATASVVAAVASLQLGALGVVIETVASGVSSLTLSTFLWLMLPIHLAIGFVEGLATAALVLFIRRARPDLVDREHSPAPAGSRLKPVAAGFALAAALTGGVFSWFASAQPDGLEWSLERASGVAELEAPEGTVHQRLAELQARLSVMPDYDLPSHDKAKGEAAPAWPEVSPGKSLAGLVGGMVTLLVVLVAATLLRRRV